MDSLTPTALSSTILCTSSAMKNRRRRRRCGMISFCTTLSSLPLFSYGLQRSSLIVPLDGYANAMTAMENGNPRAAAKLAKELLSTLPSTVNEAIGDGMDILNTLKAISHTSQLYAEALKDSKLYTTETINAYEKACQWMEYLYGINGGYTTRCLTQYETLLDTMGRYIEAEGLRTRIRLRKTLRTTSSLPSGLSTDLKTEEGDEQLNGKVPTRLGLSSSATVDQWNGVRTNEDSIPTTDRKNGDSFVTLSSSSSISPRSVAMIDDSTIASADPYAWYDTTNDSDGYINVVGDIVRGYLSMDNDTQRLTLMKLKHFSEACALDIHKEVPEYARILLNEISTFTSTEDTLQYLYNKLNDLIIQLEGKSSSSNSRTTGTTNHPSNSLPIVPHESILSIDSIGVDGNLVNEYDTTIDTLLVSSEASSSSSSSSSSSNSNKISSKQPPVIIPTSNTNRYRNAFPRTNNLAGSIDPANSIPTIMTSNKNGQNTVTYAGIKTTVSSVNPTMVKNSTEPNATSVDDAMIEENSTISSSLSSSTATSSRLSLGIHVAVPQGAAKIWRPDTSRRNSGANGEMITTEVSTATTSEAIPIVPTDDASDTVSNIPSSASSASSKLRMQESWEYDPSPPTYESRKSVTAKRSSSSSKDTGFSRRSLSNGVSRMSPYRRHKLLDQLRVIERFIEILPVPIKNNDMNSKEVLPLPPNDNTIDTISTQTTGNDSIDNGRSNGSILSSLSTNTVTDDSTLSSSSVNTVNDDSKNEEKVVSLFYTSVMSVWGMIMLSLLPLVSLIVWWKSRNKTTAIKESVTNNSTRITKATTNANKSTGNSKTINNTNSTSSQVSVSSTSSTNHNTMNAPSVSTPETVTVNKTDSLKPSVAAIVSSSDGRNGNESSTVSTGSESITNPSTPVVSIATSETKSTQSSSSKKKKNGNITNNSNNTMNDTKSKLSRPSPSPPLPVVSSSLSLPMDGSSTVAAVKNDFPLSLSMEKKPNDGTNVSVSVDTPEKKLKITATATDSLSSFVPTDNPNVLPTASSVATATNSTRDTTPEKQSAPDDVPSSIPNSNASTNNNAINNNVTASPKRNTYKTNNTNNNVTRNITPSFHTTKNTPSSPLRNTSEMSSGSSSSSSSSNVPPSPTVNPKISPVPVSSILLPPSSSSPTQGTDSVASGPGAMPTLASIVTANLAIHAPFTLPPKGKSESTVTPTKPHAIISSSSSSSSSKGTKPSETSTVSTTKTEHTPSATRPSSSLSLKSTDTTTKSDSMYTVGNPKNALSSVPRRSSVEFSTLSSSSSTTTERSSASPSVPPTVERITKDGKNGKSRSIVPVSSSSDNGIVKNETEQIIPSSAVILPNPPSTAVPFQPPLSLTQPASVMYVPSYPPPNNVPYYTQPSPSSASAASVPVPIMTNPYPSPPPLPPSTQPPPLPPGTMYGSMMPNPHYSPLPYGMPLSYNPNSLPYPLPMNMMIPYYPTPVSPSHFPPQPYPSVTIPSYGNGPSPPLPSPVAISPSSSSVTGKSGKTSTAPPSETGSSSNGSTMVTSSSLSKASVMNESIVPIHHDKNNGGGTHNGTTDGSALLPMVNNTTVSTASYTVPYPPTNLSPHTMPTMIHADHLYGFTNGSNGVGWYLLGPITSTINNGANNGGVPVPPLSTNNGSSSGNNSNNNNSTTTASIASATTQFTIPHILTTTTTTTTTTVTTPTGTATATNGFSTSSGSSNNSSRNGETATTMMANPLHKNISNGSNRNRGNQRRDSMDQHNTSVVSKNSDDGSMDPTV